MTEGHAKLSHDLITSSLWSEDDDIRIVFITLLAMADKNGNVHTSIPGLANAARKTVSQTEKALNNLKSPDPYSRSPELDGARLTMADGVIHLVTYVKRRNERDPESRREQNRLAQKRKRDSRKQIRNADSQPIVSHGQPRSAHTDTDTDTDKEKHKKKTKAKFKPPTPSEATSYAQSIGFDLDGENFCAFYESKGWMIGKNHMKSWKSAVVTWKKSHQARNPESAKATHQATKADLDTLFGEN